MQHRSRNRIFRLRLAQKPDLFQFISGVSRNSQVQASPRNLVLMQMGAHSFCGLHIPANRLAAQSQGLRKNRKPFTSESVAISTLS